MENRFVKGCAMLLVSLILIGFGVVDCAGTHQFRRGGGAPFSTAPAGVFMFIAGGICIAGAVSTFFKRDGGG